MKRISFLAYAIALTVITTLSIFTSSLKAQDARVPNPDFSELKKWYQMDSWTYESTGYIKFNIKALTNPPQTHRVFVCKFFDQSGKEVSASTLMGVGYSTPRGQEEHIEVYAPDAGSMKKVKAIAVFLLDDGKYIGPAMANVMKNVGADKPEVRDNTPVVKPNVPNNNIATGCNFNALPAMNSAARYSETLAKSGIYEFYGFKVNTGGLSSPLAIGVTFLSIQSGNPFINTVTFVPGRGAQRKHDAAPVNATLYPFHTKYIVCEKYSNAIVRTQYESDYVLFKANNGNWQCGGNGVPKIEHLQ